VTHEIQSQLKEWYNHLPSVVRFPLDTSPLFDKQKSFLRIQYFGIFVVMRWESVLRLLQRGSSNPPNTRPLNEMSHFDIERDKEHVEARECIESCFLVLGVAEELLTGRGRTLANQFALWASYASLTALILTYHVDAMAYIPQTSDSRCIIRGYTMLKGWDYLPVVKQGLGRAKDLMNRVGLRIEDD
jgi:hypothetical protein